MRFPTHRAHELYAAAEMVTIITGNPEKLEQLVSLEDLLCTAAKLRTLADVLSHPEPEALVNAALAEAHRTYDLVGPMAMVRYVDPDTGFVAASEWPETVISLPPPEAAVSEHVDEHLVLRGMHARVLKQSGKGWDEWILVFANSPEGLDSPGAFRVRSLEKLRDLISALNIVLELNESASIMEERAANLRFRELGVLFYT